MDLLYCIRLVRRNWKLVPFMLALAVGAASVVTARTPPTYAATVAMLVSAHDADPSTATAYQAVLLSQQRVKSYAALLTSRKVLGTMATGDGLRNLRDNVTAEAVPDTVILQATVTDRDPGRAARLANTLASRFARLVDQIERPDPRSPATTSVTVIDPADVPDRPVSPRPLLNLGLAMVIALLLSAALAVLRDLLDTTVKTREALQELSHGPTLGIIGFERDAARQPLIVRRGLPSTRAEAFRGLRTSLQFIGVDRQPRSLLVTSCLPGEGKTSVAANLAITLAQAGWRVLLVDADLRRPSVHAYLGIEGSTGLTDVLIGAAALEEATQQWGRPGLSVLPSGRLPSNPSELLGSRTMRTLMERLTAVHDIVIIDTPPLLPVTDATALAATCDGVLFVARYGRTRRENVARAAQLLASVNARLVGTVLNCVPSRATRAGYDPATGYGADLDDRQRATLVGT
ncbi:polysaccharide biosynthesis tyrosine autokinase [Microbispora sp. ATCC PTA-5024]|uniref:polysaccharide biosynthesis tyrosine autokinase n=1 Tax=Microbispora sp. ATCC PTA-5024 TaxID=316330 RepID=UPI0003DBFD48|nr:polysaccharide biosynthesis tyrosine autokinase [Microbispora sp. ATCC PTA-5024]ETK33489.1 hypothetical protein MPTA5024_24330 [Microbispora sp. ATCC PTA-5024]